MSPKLLDSDSDNASNGSLIPEEGVPHPLGRRVFTSGGGGGFGKRAQWTDTIVTIEKQLRSHFWQGLCTSDFVPSLGTPQLRWF